MAYIDCGYCKLVSGGAREKKATPTERPEKNHDGEIKKVTPKKQALPVGDRTGDGYHGPGYGPVCIAGVCLCW